MAIGTTTALVLGGLAAGGQVAGAKLASSAAKKAATVQSDAAARAAEITGQATNRALDMQRGIWDESKGALDPYRALGAGAAGKLGFLMGIPSGGGVPSMGDVSAQPMASGQTGGGAMGAARRLAPGGSLARPGGSVDRFRSMSQPGKVVMVQAPTGEVRAVDELAAERFIARGARRIG